MSSIYNNYSPINSINNFEIGPWEKTDSINILEDSKLNNNYQS